jgi:DDE superfamily endonuclease
MDNLTAHKGDRVSELIEERGCELLYLPPYSPDFNPIEEAFAKIKGLLRKAEARTREALVEAMGTAISAVTAQDARGFFEHSGYRLQIQLLWPSLYPGAADACLALAPGRRHRADPGTRHPERIDELDSAGLAAGKALI